LQKCAEKGVKPHCSTSQGLEANTAIGIEDNGIIANIDIPSILATTTVVTEPEVLPSTVQAEIPGQVHHLTFNYHPTNFLYRNDKITTGVSDVSPASVVPDTTKFFGDGLHIENPVVTALGISEATAIVEDASQIDEPVILESSTEAPIPLNSESKTKATSHIKNISNTENSSKILSRPKTENRRSRSDGMVVRFMNEGAKNGKRNIALQTSVSTASFGPGSRQSKPHDWTTTRHYPGAVIMARENQVGSPAGNNIMPFLHIQRGDILELKEERSPNIYLVKQKWDGGLEGLIRIYRTDMKASDAAASSIHVDDSQSDKSGRRSSRETSPVTRGRGRAVVLQNKLGTSGKPGSPSPKSLTGVATKPVIKRQASASVNSAAEANAPKVPSPDYENAPHMIAARMYDQSAHPHVYVEEPLPKRTRYVEIWTPHLTDGQIIEPGSW
jgi:hypothetical protein